MLNFIINPTLQLLIFLYRLLGQNLGLAIITLTLIIRFALVPFSITSIKSAKKMQELKPHLDRLKLKHKDKQKLQQAQLDLYRQYGINPTAGCLPQLLQIIVLISLYQVFIRFLDQGQLDGFSVNTRFLWLDLAHPDPLYVLPVLAGLSQLVFSLMMQSGLEHHKAPKKDPKEADSADMAQAMQQQMLFLMPLMTGIIALRFPSGLALYWVITTLFSLFQQFIIAGPGGLIPALNKIKSFLTHGYKKN